MFTPTFSKTRPFMIAMVPPPPSLPSSVGRFHDLRVNRPAGMSIGVPAYSSSSASKAAQIRSRSSPNQALARAFRSSTDAGCELSVFTGESFELPQRFAHYHGRGLGYVERTQTRLQGNA